jgi:ribosomal protein S18 acetylase RimI-like enzyme
MVDTNWFSPFELEKVGEIHEVFVLPEYRNRGVGKMLMEKGLEYAVKKNRKVAELWVGSKNHSAKKFYKKLGFEEKNGFGKWIRMRKKIV